VICAWKSTRPLSASRWARGLRPVPDVAHSSWEVPEGTGVGEQRNPSDPASYGLDPKTATLRLKFRVVQQATRQVNHLVNDNDTVKIGSNDESNGNIVGNDQPLIPGWDAVLWRGRLYVSVTPSVLRNGSKEAFVSLLEYAEDVLEVSHVIVCCQPSDVSSNNPDNKSVLRNFMFLGFQPLAPGHQFMPSNPNLVCFYYTI